MGVLYHEMHLRKHVARVTEAYLRLLRLVYKFRKLFFKLRLFLQRPHAHLRNQSPSANQGNQANTCRRQPQTQMSKCRSPTTWRPTAQITIAPAAYPFQLDFGTGIPNAGNPLQWYDTVQSFCRLVQNAEIST